MEEGGGDFLQCFLLVPILAFSISTVLLCIFKRKVSRSKHNMPPSKAGWIPWVGVAIEFGKEPLNYIEKARKEVSTMQPMSHT